MRSLVLIALMALAGCADTGVVQVGPGRYRITQESAWTVGTAETNVIQAANEFCARTGTIPDLQMTDSRPYQPYRNAAGASANFTCVPPSAPTRSTP